MKGKFFSRLFVPASLYVGLCFAAVSVFGLNSADERMERLIEQLTDQANLSSDSVSHFETLMPLLFGYLHKVFPQDQVESLYEARTLEEFRSMIFRISGKDLLDFGRAMFNEFEKQSAGIMSGPFEKWNIHESQHFVFCLRPGSKAEADIKLIKLNAEHLYSTLSRKLGLKERMQTCFSFLRSEVSEDRTTGTTRIFPQKIVVYLHPQRESDAAKKINRLSQGSMFFGATLAPSGASKGEARLTARIDILYFNAFSLAVLHHEVAHGLLFLGSFNPAPLRNRTFKGEKDLSKAFFAGYTAIPPFLHEGIGDYALYFHGLYVFWPVLPSPKDILSSLFAANRFIPLQKLLRESLMFRMRNHKEYTLEAACFIDFCLRFYGKEKLKEWLLNAGKKPLQTFEATYGITISRAETLWLKDLGLPLS